MSAFPFSFPCLLYSKPSNKTHLPIPPLRILRGTRKTRPKDLADGWGQAADGRGGESVNALDEGNQVADGKEVLH